MQTYNSRGNDEVTIFITNLFCCIANKLFTCILTTNALKQFNFINYLNFNNSDKSRKHSYLERKEKNWEVSNFDLLHVKNSTRAIFLSPPLLKVLKYFTYL